MIYDVKDDFPKVAEGLRILITGASSGIGLALTRALLQQKGLQIGAHYATRKNRLNSLFKNHKRVKFFKGYFHSEKDCIELVKRFCAWAGSIDALVVCSGGIANAVHWSKQKEKDWEHDIFLNLNVPFYLARATMKNMKRGGRIILFGTESALHGGNLTSLGYGVAKMGIECLVKALARDGAKKGILVNLIRPGFIASGFHQRWQKKSREDIEKRVSLIPLKRAGTPEEVAALIAYLLSDWSGFITGQSFAITGGDWL